MNNWQLLADICFFWPLGQTGPTSTILSTGKEKVEISWVGGGDGVVDDLLRGCRADYEYDQRASSGTRTAPYWKLVLLRGLALRSILVFE